MDESRDAGNVKLERWRKALKFKGFGTSCTKTEYMNCNFSRKVQRNATPVRIEIQEILQRNSF